MKEHDKKWADKEMLALLDSIRIDKKKKCYSQDTISYARARWMMEGCPLLTDEARAVLDVVEEVMERCAKCTEKNNCENAFLTYFGAKLIQTGCPLEPIRRAWKRKKP